MNFFISWISRNSRTWTFIVRNHCLELAGTLMFAKAFNLNLAESIIFGNKRWCWVSMITRSPPGPLEFIKVHLWQLFPPGDVGLEVEAASGQRDRDLPGFVFGCPPFHVTYIENIFYQMPYIYMACYLLSTIPFRPLLSYKSDRLEVHSCTIFLSVAWMVKYRNDPYRNSNMNNKIIELGN